MNCDHYSGHPRVASVIAGGSNGHRPAIRTTARRTTRSGSRAASSSINVTATVTDANGRFVPGLRQEDFTSTKTTSSRTSPTSAPSGCRSAWASCSTPAAAWPAKRCDNALAAHRSLPDELLDPDDEIFLYRFSNFPGAAAGLDDGPAALEPRARAHHADGGTAMYDAVAEAVPLAQTGQNRKKAIVLISDGNDTDSDTSLSASEAADPRDRGAGLRDRHRRPARRTRRSACRMPPTAPAAADPAVRFPAAGVPRGHGGIALPFQTFRGGQPQQRPASSAATIA